MTSRVDKAALKALHAFRGPDLLTTQEGKRRVHHVARFALCDQVLRDPIHFSAAIYDDKMAALIPGHAMILSGDAESRAQSQALLRAVQDHITTHAQLDDAPNGESYLIWVHKMATHHARTVADCLARSYGDRPINIIRDYAQMVFYQMAKSLFGLRLADGAPMALRVAEYGNRLLGAKPVSIRGEGAAAASYALYSPLVFAHLFRQFGDNALMRRVAQWAVQPMVRAFDVRQPLPFAPPPHSMLAAGLALYREWPVKERSAMAHRLTIILTELAGTVPVVPRNAFVNIIAQATHGPLAAQAPLARLARAEDHQVDRILTELIRVTDSGTRVLRMVAQPTTLCGTEMVPGDLVNLYLARANHDPAQFVEPGHFNPARGEANLVFGPQGGPHACYGQAIGRTILAAMLREIYARFDPIKPGAAVRAAATPFAQALWRVRQ